MSSWVLLPRTKPSAEQNSHEVGKQTWAEKWWRRMLSERWFSRRSASSRPGRIRFHLLKKNSSSRTKLSVMYFIVAATFINFWYGGVESLFNWICTFSLIVWLFFFLRHFFNYVSLLFSVCFRSLRRSSLLHVDTRNQHTWVNDTFSSRWSGQRVVESWLITANFLSKNQ